MSNAIKHKKDFTSFINDSTDSTRLRPSDWSTEHVLGGAANDGQPIIYKSGNSDHADWAAAGNPIIIPAVTGFVMQIDYQGTGALGNFNTTVGHFTNPGDGTRDDHVTYIGYNVKSGGQSEVAGEPYMSWNLEDYYAPVSGGPYIECYWEYHDSSGAGFRPIFFQVNRTVGGYLTDSTIQNQAKVWTYLAQDGTQCVKIVKNEILVLNGTFVDNYQNNFQWLRQINQAGSGLIPLIYANNSNKIVIGGSNAAGLVAASQAVSPALTGTRYLIIDTSGNITSSASAPSGT